MGFFKSAAKKVKEVITPKDPTLQMAETKKKLMGLESRFESIIMRERNVVNSVKTKAARKDAEERLRNAYISLRLVHIAQERLYDAMSTYDLKNAIGDLGKSMAVINKIGKKNGQTAPGLLLNLRSKGLLKAQTGAEEGGLKNYYDVSVEELLVGEESMKKLIDTTLPLEYVLEKDEETLECVDEFMGFAVSADNDFGDIEISDELDELMNNLG